MKREKDSDPSVFERVNRRQLLKGTLGVAVSAAGVSALSGITAAHFPTTLDVVITPDSENNCIVPSRDELITVAVLTTTYQTEGREQTTFNPTEKAVRYRFGAPSVLENGGGVRPVGDGQIKDVNGDGKPDLVLQFPVEETGFSGDETVGRLLWERDKSGEHGLAGEAPVTIVMETDNPEQKADNKQDGKQTDDSEQTDEKQTGDSKQADNKQGDDGEQDDDKQKSDQEGNGEQADDGTQESEQEADEPC
jgi:hypothetical protein